MFSKRLVNKLPANSIAAITGHCGFIGRALVKRLEGAGFQVIKLSGDVRDDKIFREDFDVLFHLAAALPVKFDVPDPLESEAYQVNTIGTRNALQACRERNAHLVFTSTSGVYGPASNQALGEDANIDPQTSYAISKYHAENICRKLSEEFSIKVSVLRLFNIYGPGQSDDLVLPYLIKCALNAQTAHVRSPDSGRDFLHVNDVVKALFMTIGADVKTFEVFNVGAGKSTCIRDLVALISQTVGNPIDVTFGDDEGTTVWADISKFQKQFSWRPSHQLEIEIPKIITSHTG